MRLEPSALSAGLSLHSYSVGSWLAELIAEKVSPALGQQIIVENRGGAGGRIAAELVARSPKDGYTLLLGSAATLITGPALDADRKYDPVKDFAPISLAGTTAYILVAHPSLPVKTVRNLISLAKASPGRIAYATTRQGAAREARVAGAGPDSYDVYSPPTQEQSRRSQEHAMTAITRELAEIAAGAVFMSFERSILVPRARPRRGRHRRLLKPGNRQDLHDIQD